MAEHIPFISGEDGCKLVKSVYSDSEVIRVPLERAPKLLGLRPHGPKIWLDPGVDGLDDLKTRQSEPGKKNSWFEFMKGLPHFENMAATSFQAHPTASEVSAFVKGVLDRCAVHKPAWLTVPQLPLANDATRNKINRALATATGKWKSNHGFAGRLILPIVVTHQDQVSGKTARNPKVQHAERCYHDAQADGLWIVDKSLTDDSGSGTLRAKRFPAIIALHEELNERISSKIRVAGPYWGLNLVLWARGLVDFPAIGIGSGYQFFLSGGHAKQASARLMLPSLRRRVSVSPTLKTWLDSAISTLASSHPAHAEFSEIRKHFSVLSEPERAREQIAGNYKRWFNSIASAPRPGRSMALFQDLSTAYALGKSLPELPDEGTARRPEAVAESLMLSCL